MGGAALAPGRYFRLLLIGYIEGIDSERGIAWRAADSLALRSFLGVGLKEMPPRSRHLSTKLCLRESCGGLETGMECGIELMKGRTDGPAWSFPSALLQRGDGQTEFQL